MISYEPSYFPTIFIDIRINKEYGAHGQAAGLRSGLATSIGYLTIHQQKVWGELILLVVNMKKS